MSLFLRDMCFFFHARKYCVRVLWVYDCNWPQSRPVTSCQPNTFLSQISMLYSQEIRLLKQAVALGPCSQHSWKPETLQILQENTHDISSHLCFVACENNELCTWVNERDTLGKVFRGERCPHIQEVRLKPDGGFVASLIFLFSNHKFQIIVTNVPTDTIIGTSGVRCTCHVHSLTVLGRYPTSQMTKPMHDGRYHLNPVLCFALPWIIFKQSPWTPLRY